jgi:hypothetical protein
MTDNHQKTVVGWSEYVEFPEWDMPRLHAKLDTGARTSAIHVEEMRVLPGGWVEFQVVRSRHRPERRHPVRARILKWAKVRSSTGEFRRRCFVKTRVRIGNVEKEIEISLVSREKMLFRMLLGRKALEKDFLVDASRRNVLDGKPRKRS